MDNKAQLNIHNPLVLLAITITFIIIILLLMSADINFSIQIPNDEFERGGDFNLSYKVSNNLLYGDIHTVNISYDIYNNRNRIIESDYFAINKIPWRQEEPGTFLIDTSYYNIGEYTIWVSVHYYKYGILEAKYLSLKFTVT